MKKIYLLLVCLVVAASCTSDSTEMSSNYPKDYDLNYALNKVIEFDDVNINGIDVCPYFDFFETFTLVIHYKDSKVVSFELDNGDIPFSPYSTALPQGVVECYFDSDHSPNTIKLKSNDEPVIYYGSGEFYIPFQLDCETVSYEYHFKEIK